MSQFPDYKKGAVAKLIPYARNARMHSEEQIKQVAASIREFGFLAPVITDGDNGILAGHCRVLAAQRLGLTELPCIEAAHLSKAQRRAYIIADNKLADNSAFDDQILRIELDELGEQGFDVSLTGFSVDEIESIDLKQNLFSQPEESSSRELDADKFEGSHTCPKCGFEFDD